MFLRPASDALRLTALLFAALCLCACDVERSPSAAPTDEDVAAPRVSILRVLPERVVVYDELPGRVMAYRTAEIRPQVSGIIRNKLFEEGATVEAQTPLFQIDPAPFAADVEAGSAVLARSEAELMNARGKFDRATLLSAQKIVSVEALNDATAALAQAKANVAEARANLERRKLELSYATIRSPIAGVIGQSFMSEGGLASSAATAPLAVVQQIDQVYLDVRQSSMDKEALEDIASSGGEKIDALPVRVISLSGKPHDQPGKVLFSDISVDAATGSLGVRILVPNPGRHLLPGMYLRAEVPRAVHAGALMVPQEAVLRDPSGRPQLLVMAQDGTAGRRNVELGALVNGRYIVRQGLSSGDTVVVLGQDRVQPGARLQTTPYKPSPEQES